MRNTLNRRIRSALHESRYEITEASNSDAKDVFRELTLGISKLNSVYNTSRGEYDKSSIGSEIALVEKIIKNGLKGLRRVDQNEYPALHEYGELAKEALRIVDRVWFGWISQLIRLKGEIAEANLDVKKEIYGEVHPYDDGDIF